MLLGAVLLGLLVAQWAVPGSLRAADEDQAEPQPIPIAEIKRDKPVDFETEILPILKRNCLACHNASDAKGELVLETPETIRKGGASGEVVTPGNGAESYLLEVASAQNDPVMPPPDNKVGAKPLTSEELGLLKLWIDQGAKGTVTGNARQITWQPLPPGVNPIYAVALSSDGQYAACGRAGQIFIYHVPTGRTLGRLTDPVLREAGQYAAGVAHRDLVQSLAFSPDGRLLASGGYRVVKLWQRTANAPLDDDGLQGQAPPQMALSANRQRLATVEDNVVVVRHPQNGDVTGRLEGAAAPIVAIALVPDGSQLFASTEDNKLLVWNVADAKLLHTLDTPARINALAATADGKTLLGAGDDGLVYLWSNPPAEPRTLSGHSGPVRVVVAWPGDANRFVSAGQDGSIRVWEVASGKQTLQINHGAPVRAVAIRNDGARIASAGETKLVRLWNAADGKPVADIQGDVEAVKTVQHLKLAEQRAATKLAAYQGVLKGVQQDADAKSAAAKKATEALAAAEKALATAKSEAQAATQAVAKAEKHVTDTQAALKAATEAKAAAEKLAARHKLESQAIAAVVAQWAAASQAHQQALQAAQAALKSLTQAAAKDPQSKELADARAAAEALVAKATALAKESSALHAQTVKKAEALAAAAKQSDEKLAAAVKALQAATAEAKKAPEALAAAKKTADEKAKAVKPAEDKLASARRAVEQAQQIAQRAMGAVAQATAVRDASQQALEQAKKRLAESQAKAAELEQPSGALAFSPDNKLLAVGSATGRVGTYTADNGRSLESFAAHTGPVQAVAFLDDGRFLSLAADRHLLQWRAYPQWSLARRIGPPADAPLDVARSSLIDRVLAIDFSPDGQLLATGGGQPSRTGELKIWKVADGSLVTELPEAHSDTVFCVRFSPEGDRLASSAADKFVKVFEVASGKLLRVFEGHTHHVLGVSWRADDKTLASCGADAVVKVWNLETGEQIRTIGGFGKQATAIQFVAHTPMILTAAGDRVVRMHNTDNGKGVRTFSGSTDYIYALAVSEDGKLLAAGGQDSVLRIWNVDDAKLLISFPPPKPQPQQQAAR